MNLSSPTIIKQILQKYNIKPSKSLGQNFLINKNILSKIIKASNLSKNDIVLEVGPGIGTLTYELAQNASKVIAIEKDHDMINILQETLSEFNNVNIVEDDILEISNFQFLISNQIQKPNAKYKVVANIPYYLTSHLIRTFLECENQPQEIILLIQKEVAQRITAKPPHMNLLAVSVQYYAKPEIISYVPRNCFLPAPKVDSAIIKITPHISSLSFSQKRESREFNDLFFKVVKAGFSHPRKQLANNFCSELDIEKEAVQNWLLQNNIKPTQRAETLSVNNWKNLANSFIIK